MNDLVPYSAIEDAAETLRGVAHRTPVLTSRTLDQRIGAQVLLKCENLQRTGSFKFRGAYNAVARHMQAHPEQGIVAYSSGNHAQAISLASQLLGAEATIVMPEDAPRIKLAATRGYGAEVVLYDRFETTREEIAAQLAQERGLAVIPSFDHPDVIAGQGTTAKELYEDAGPLDLLLVCCGGAGLLSGCARATRTLAPDCRIIGVEPEMADDAARSFRTGELHSVSNPDTIADGARTPSLGEITFPMVLELVDDMVTVSEQSIVAAMELIWSRLKLVVEPTGSLALAALLDGTVETPRGRARRCHSDRRQRRSSGCAPAVRITGAGRRFSVARDGLLCPKKSVTGCLLHQPRKGRVLTKGRVHRISGRLLAHVPASVGRQGLSGDELGLVAGQVDGGPGDVVDVAEAHHRRLGGDQVAHLAQRLGHVGVDPAWGDGVDTNIPGHHLARQRAGEAEDPCLGRAVVHGTAATGGAHDRAHVDDRAGHLRPHDLERFTRTEERAVEMHRDHAVPLVVAHLDRAIGVHRDWSTVGDLLGLRQASLDPRRPPRRRWCGRCRRC